MNENKSIRAASRKTRVYVFREFLLQTYANYLREGDTILDVAGGKGDLSWLLRNFDNIDSVVVDPRITKNHIVKSVHYLRAHPDVAKERAIPGRLSFQPLAALIPKVEGKATFSSPRHMRILVDDNLVNAVSSFKREPDRLDDWARYWRTATEIARESQLLGYKEDEGVTDQQIQEAKEALKSILSAKLIVGFHPDQATDPCIDLAAILGVPVCIVPCCVFPSEFSHRRLADGSRVRCYKELIEYLISKSPNMQKSFLNFHFTDSAKNIALFTLPAVSGEALSHQGHH